MLFLLLRLLPSSSIFSFSSFSSSSSSSSPNVLMIIPALSSSSSDSSLSLSMNSVMYLLCCTSVTGACVLCVCPPCLRRIVWRLNASSRSRPLLPALCCDLRTPCAATAATLILDDAAAAGAGAYADDDACSAAPTGDGKADGDGAGAGAACATCTCCCCCRGCCCCFCLLRSLYTDWHSLFRSCHIPLLALIQ